MISGNHTAVSLFSGAGGMDVGMVQAGFKILLSNEINPDACATYRSNLGDHMVDCGIEDAMDQIQSVAEQSDVDLVFGGPPCQGFSVAGKMDPADPRSGLVWNFLKVVEELSPRAFVMENVKALGSLKRWGVLRERLLSHMRGMGYATNFVVLNANNFNVPQSRERVFFMGFKGNSRLIPDFRRMHRRFPTVESGEDRFTGGSKPPARAASSVPDGFRCKH